MEIPFTGSVILGLLILVTTAVVSIIIVSPLKLIEMATFGHGKKFGPSVPWTNKQQTISICFGGFVSLISVTVVLLGFPDFNSVNVTIMLLISAIGITTFAISFIVCLVLLELCFPDL